MSLLTNACGLCAGAAIGGALVTSRAQQHRSGRALAPGRLTLTSRKCLLLINDVWICPGAAVWWGACHCKVTAASYRPCTGIWPPAIRLPSLAVSVISLCPLKMCCVQQHQSHIACLVTCLVHAGAASGGAPVAARTQQHRAGCALAPGHLTSDHHGQRGQRVPVEAPRGRHQAHVRFL